MQISATTSGSMAQLIDASNQLPAAGSDVSQKSKSTPLYPLDMPPTGTGIRVFRITNVRIDGT